VGGKLPRRFSTAPNFLSPGPPCPGTPARHTTPVGTLLDWTGNYVGAVLNVLLGYLEVVPEPSALTLVGFALAVTALALRRCRR